MIIEREEADLEIDLLIVRKEEMTMRGRIIDPTTIILPPLQDQEEIMIEEETIITTETREEDPTEEAEDPTTNQEAQPIRITISMKAP